MAYKQGITYIESTWTPVITGSSSNPTITYTSQSGVYTRIGNIVLAKSSIAVNTTSGGSGNLQVSLPITSSSDSISNLGVSYTATVAFPTSAKYIVSDVEPNSAVCIFVGVLDNASPANIQISDIAAGDVIRFSIFYSV